MSNHEHCHVGSCKRHQDCMYTPCRASVPPMTSNDQTPAWGSPVEREVRRRVQASVAAYGYEFENKSIMLDAHFDELVQTIKPQLTTGHPLLDEFFLTKFSPMTGMWVHEHPELEKIKALFEKYYRDNPHWVDSMTRLHQH